MDRLDDLRLRIGNTPIYEISQIPIPNGNRIFAKQERLNPTGSHYDRIYATLFSALESEGKIHRGQTRLIETSSGCAGASFAWFCDELGYPASVVVPEDLPKSRIRAITKHGARIVTSPAGAYMRGAVETLREVLLEDKSEAKSCEERLFCVNHSQDQRTLTSMHAIAHEVKHQLPVRPDFFVGACGNGASLIGIGSELKDLFPGLRVVACEPVESPAAFDRRYPGRYEQLHGEPPHAGQHNVYGTGGWGLPFPFLEEPLFSRVVDDAQLVTAPEREAMLKVLHETERQFVGRSSALSLAAALEVCQDVSNSTFLILFYDSFANYE